MDLWPGTGARTLIVHSMAQKVPGSAARFKSIDAGAGAEPPAESAGEVDDLVVIRRERLKGTPAGTGAHHRDTVTGLEAGSEFPDGVADEVHAFEAASQVVDGDDDWPPDPLRFVCGRARGGTGLWGDNGAASDFAGFAVLEKFEFVWDRPVMTLPDLIGDDGVGLDEIDGDADERGVGIWLLLGNSGEGQDDCRQRGCRSRPTRFEAPFSPAEKLCYTCVVFRWRSSAGRASDL